MNPVASQAISQVVVIQRATNFTECMPSPRDGRYSNTMAQRIFMSIRWIEGLKRHGFILVCHNEGHLNIIAYPVTILKIAP